MDVVQIFVPHLEPDSDELQALFISVNSIASLKARPSRGELEILWNFKVKHVSYIERNDNQITIGLKDKSLSFELLNRQEAEFVQIHVRRALTYHK
jgi:hypothetical protein